MRRIISTLMLSLCCLMASAQSAELPLVEIGTLSTTHILFMTDLTYVDISRQDVIVAKVVEASKNMLAIKAKGEFGFVTTISALEANGTMHTFRVKYNPFPENLVFDTRVASGNRVSGGVVNTQIRPAQGDGSAKVSTPSSTSVPSSSTGMVTMPASSATGVVVTSDESSNFGKADAPTLEEVMKMPQKIYHIGDKNYNIEAYCTNIFVYSDVLYLVLTIYNNTDIGYEAGDAQFAIESAGRNKKQLISDKDIWAKSSYGSLSCPTHGMTQVGYTIPKFTLLKEECLKIYIYEKKGVRNLILTLYDEDINFAVSPK